MPYQPVNFGNAMIQGENILNARHSRDPNSLQNQLLAAKIADLQNTGPDLFGGVPKPTSQMKNDVYRMKLIDDIKAGIRPKEDLPRFEEWVRASQYRDIMNVPTQFSGGQPGKPLSTLGGEGAADAYLENMKQLGKQSAQAGQRYDAPITTNDVDLGVQSPSQPQAATLPVPTSEATLAGSKTESMEQAKVDVELKATRAQHLRDYKVYRVARSNLERALKGTMTGYFSGKIAPVGASAQVAENAGRIIFPAIKSLVRGPGEGVFTDDDAARVQTMLPTRETHPDALPAVLYQIDSFVASKLEQPLPPLPDGMIERPTWIAENDPRWHALSNEEKTAVIQAGGQ